MHACIHTYIHIYTLVYPLLREVIVREVDLLDRGDAPRELAKYCACLLQRWLCLFKITRTHWKKKKTTRNDPELAKYWRCLFHRWNVKNRELAKYCRFRFQHCELSKCRGPLSHRWNVKNRELAKYCIFWFQHCELSKCRGPLFQHWNNKTESLQNTVDLSFLCVDIYIYIYIHMYTHTYTYRGNILYSYHIYSGFLCQRWELATYSRPLSQRLNNKEHNGLQDLLDGGDAPHELHDCHYCLCVCIYIYIYICVVCCVRSVLFVYDWFHPPMFICIYIHTYIHM